MADSALNIVDPAIANPSSAKGDVPDRLRRRYFTDESQGPGLAFYVDASVKIAAFRDQGHRLSTDRNDPNVVRDLVAIAQHRGWTIVSVRGQTGFRREVWIAARAAGLEVRGYRPTERDLQDLLRRAARPPEPPLPVHERKHAQRDDGIQARLRIVEAVVRNRVVEPSEQERILAAARGRLAAWLDRGSRFDGIERSNQPRHQDRHR